jgi:hypothetical protein
MNRLSSDPDDEHNRELSDVSPDFPSTAFGPGTHDASRDVTIGGEGISPDSTTSAGMFADLYGPFLDRVNVDRQIDQERAPSLPIVLISAACGITGGIIGLYISTSLLDFGIALSAAMTTLGLLFGLGISGAALTAVTGERGAIVNIAFSCTLIALMVLFMTMCAVAGAALATFLIKV